jgi:Chaperone of endosialidase
MLDFPNNPTVGQTFVSAGITWTWDGTKWTGSGGSGSGGGIPDAPSNGQLYGRQNATWAVVPAGGTGGISDAPSDGETYGRENGGWVVIPSTVGGAFTVPNPLEVLGTGTTGGGLGSNPANASLILYKSTGADFASVAGFNGSTARWQILLGDSALESGGNVGSGFQIANFSDSGVQIAFPMQISRATSVTTFSNTIVNGPSDRRLKENIAPLTGSLEKVLALQGVSFNMISTPTKKEIGLIAQDVEPVVPEVIQGFEQKDGPMMAIDYPKLVAHLIESIKTLNTKVTTLENAMQRVTLAFTPGAT